MPTKRPRLADLEQLRQAATRARDADAKLAAADLTALRALLPLAPRGPERARAAALLAKLTTRRALAALGHRTLEELLRGATLPISVSTARRLLASAASASSGAKAPPKAALRRLGQLERRIRKNLRDADLKAWDIGRDFDRIAKDRLHRLRDPELTLAEWADATYPEHGYRTLGRYRRIARAFTRPTASRFGTSKLDLGLRWLDLTPADDRPAELARLTIPVPGKGAIPFAKITLSDLERAVAALATTISTPKPQTLPRGAATLLARARAALSALPHPDAHPLPTLSARVLKTGDTQSVVFTAHDLSHAALAAVLQALASAGQL